MCPFPSARWWAGVKTVDEELWRTAKVFFG